MADLKYECIVMGASAGGMQALTQVLSPLPADFPVPIVAVQHMHRYSEDSYMVQYLNERCRLKVKEADEKEEVRAGYIFIAPSNYHLLIDNKRTISLSVDEKVNYSRPSIDVLFESASDVYGPKLIGIVLTGASSDGASGLKIIKDGGGLAIVQDPKTAESDIMPLSAIKVCRPDHILSLTEITEFLVKLNMAESPDVKLEEENYETK